MKALGMIEVYSFTTAVCAADAAAKAADVKVIAFDRNRPISPDVPAPLVMEIKLEGSLYSLKNSYGFLLYTSAKMRLNCFTLKSEIIASSHISRSLR